MRKHNEATRANLPCRAKMRCNALTWISNHLNDDSMIASISTETDNAAEIGPIFNEMG